jgi:hypothetical protein
MLARRVRAAVGLAAEREGVATIGSTEPVILIFRRTTPFIFILRMAAPVCCADQTVAVVARNYARAKRLCDAVRFVTPARLETHSQNGMGQPLHFVGRNPEAQAPAIGSRESERNPGIERVEVVMSITKQDVNDFVLAVIGRLGQVGNVTANANIHAPS